MMTNTARTLHSLRRYRIQKIKSSQQLSSPIRLL
jgi:hypothetical protein